MSDKIRVQVGSIGFFELLTILFVGLKLGGVVSWNWFWVLSPVLIPLMILGVVILGALLVGCIVGLLTWFN